MTRYFLLIIYFTFSVLSLQAQEAVNNGVLVVIGDSLEGKVIDGERYREFISNVIITQDDVRITCDRALQNLTRNEIELTGNVIVTQDSIILKTPNGKYYGNDKVAFSKEGVKLFDGHINLKAELGYYYFDDSEARFAGDVELQDSVSTLTSNFLNFFNDENKTIAVGDVFVKDTLASSMLADSLVHFRDEGIIHAFGRVEVKDGENDITIFCHELFDDRDSSYRKIMGDPVFMQIDTTDSGGLDTLMITSILMEQINDSIPRFIATDSVKILRGEFSSDNNYSILYKDSGTLLTFKRPDEEQPPVLWFDKSQLTGDSVYIYLNDNELESIDIRQNGLIVSNVDSASFRFDQMSGDHIILSFNNDELNDVSLTGSVLSIYYYYDEEIPNGLLKSSAGSGDISFKDGSISDVRLFGAPVSEYHPENVVVGKEKEYTIPTFILYKTKPFKSMFLKKLPKKIFYKRGE